MNALAIKAFWVVLLASVLVFGGYLRGYAACQGGAGAPDKAEAAIKQLASLSADAAVKAKAASQKVKAATADANKRYQEAQREAKESGDALAAALRTGAQGGV